MTRKSEKLWSACFALLAIGVLGIAGIVASVVTGEVWLLKLLGPATALVCLTGQILNVLARNAAMKEACEDFGQTATERVSDHTQFNQSL